MTPHPHEWILQYKATIIGLVIAGIVSWIAGNIFRYLIDATTPTTQSWTYVNIAQTPSFPNLPIILSFLLIIVMIALLTYYGLPPGYHGRPK
jgi:uncharacterized membrane protein YoaT (DUF817 family)